MEYDKKLDITIIGNAIADVLVYPANQNIFNVDSQPVKEIKITYGGDALNEATVLAHLGKKVELISAVGSDETGLRILNHLKDINVSTNKITKKSDVSTSVNLVIVEDTGERHFLTVPSSSQRKLFEEDIVNSLNGVGEIVSFASMFISPPLNISAMTNIFKKIKEKGSTLIVDMTTPKCQETLEDLRNLLPYIDYLIPNEREISLLTGTTDSYINAKKLIDAGVGCAVIKRGKKGCLIGYKNTTIRIPSYPFAKCLDTTGAGDNFVAGFIWALSKKWTAFDAGCFATAVSSLVIEEIGATLHEYGIEKIFERYRIIKEIALKDDINRIESQANYE